MATTSDELKIDLDALDTEKAAKDKNKAETDAKSAKNAPKDDVQVVSADDASKTPVLTPEAGLEKLRKQLEDEKTARLAAEQRAQDASAAELRARTESQDNSLHLVTNAIATVTQANDLLESRYAEALTAQDFASAAKIQREMATNAAKLIQLEAGKTQLEKQPKPVARAPSDPVEQFAGQLSPRSAGWVRAHPEFVRDAQKNRQMLAAHEIALARGLQADTDDYFKSIERTLDIAAPEPGSNGHDKSIEVDPMADAAQVAAPRRAAPAAAPVTRSGNGAGNRPNVVTLTPQEVEIAEMMQMTPEEYARQKIALKREGRMN